MTEDVELQKELERLKSIKTLNDLNDYIENSDIIKHVMYDCDEDKILLLDQTELPFERKYLELTDASEAARAIKEMKVRGGGSLAITGAYGMLLSARLEGDFSRLKEAGQMIKDTRPTASSLGWIVDKILEEARRGGDLARSTEEIVVKYVRDKIKRARKLAVKGAKLVERGDKILTHCHAGAIAGAGYGGITTGIFKIADQQGKDITVYSTETRPYLQGARITTWELKELNISTRLITDSMAGHFLQRGEIDIVIVGADRVASNGDVANKVGTYMISLAANENDVPVYAGGHVDFSTEKGEDIPIEMRSSREVTHLNGKRIATPGVEAKYPAFDVTPHRFISGIITAEGVIEPPFSENLKVLKQ